MSAEGPLHFGLSITDLHFHGRCVQLTNTRASILYALMENSGCVISHETLAKKIWGDHYQEGMKAFGFLYATCGRKLGNRSI